MKTVLQIVIVLCAFLSIGKSEEATTLGNEIIADINSGRVDHVEVLLTQEGMESIVSLDEELLEKWGKKATIKKFSQHKATPLLLSVLKTLRLNPKTENLDLRYGCKFYDSKGTVIHTLYIDGFLERGKCNGKPVIISKKIKDWIEAVRKEKPEEAISFTNTPVATSRKPTISLEEALAKARNYLQQNKIRADGLSLVMMSYSKNSDGKKWLDVNLDVR